MYVKSNRDNHSSFSTVSAWLKSRNNHEDDEQLCNAITQGKRPEVKSLTGGHQLRNFPVITPILGSGCLWAGRNDTRLPDLIAEAVDRDIEQLLGAGAETDPPGWLAFGLDDATRLPPTALLDIRHGVSEFCRDLAVDRLGLRDKAGGPVGGSSSAGSEWELTDPAVRIATAAWAFTRWYRLAQARESPPFPRRDIGYLQQLRVSPQDRAVAKALAELAHCALHNAPSLPSDEVAGFLQRLAEGAHDLVADNRTSASPIAVQDIRALTELAWYHLAGRSIGVVGWSDLLFSVARSGATEKSLHLRPLVRDTKDLARQLETLLRPVALDSWTERVARKTSASENTAARLQFFDVVAQLIRAEARLEPWTRLPGTCFVTSFDLELVFALAAAAGPGEVAAHVVVPVHARREDQDRGTLVWLQGALKRAIRSEGSEPGAEDCAAEDEKGRVITSFVIDGWELAWVLLSEDEMARGKNEVAGAGVPFVIHLTGCPLLELPATAPDHWGLKTLLPRSSIKGAEKPVVLEHAVSIDEPLAVQHAQLDALMAVPKDSRSRLPSQLPFLLVGDSASPTDTRTPNYRFWVTVGVPLWDASIRVRLLSQLFSRRVLAATPKSINDSTEIMGIVVGKGVALEGRAAAYWLDFDVVTDDGADSVQKALRHFLLHLQELCELKTALDAEQLEDEELRSERNIDLNWPAKNRPCALRVVNDGYLA